ncbi:MAG: hypothetical protein ABI699_13360 [Caldimonas sp.]
MELLPSHFQTERAPQTGHRREKSVPAMPESSFRRASGAFRFERVPTGSWYVFANVVWREGDEVVPRGGSLMRRVDVTGQP